MSDLTLPPLFLNLLHQKFLPAPPNPNFPVFLSKIIILARDGFILVLIDYSSQGRSLQIIFDINFVVTLKQVPHHHEIKLLIATAHYDFMEAKESSYQCMGVFIDMEVVVRNKSSEKNVLVLTEGLQHVFAVVTVVEETSAFSCGALAH